MLVVKPEDGIENITRNVDIIPTTLGRVITQKGYNIKLLGLQKFTPVLRANRGTTKPYLKL